MCTFFQGIESIVVKSIRKYLEYPDRQFMKNEPYKLKFRPSTFIQEHIPLPNPLSMLAMVKESYKLKPKSCPLEFLRGPIPLSDPLFKLTVNKCIIVVILFMDTPSRLALATTCQIFYKYKYEYLSDYEMFYRK
jgi:hypothetical protein